MSRRLSLVLTTLLGSVLAAVLGPFAILAQRSEPAALGVKATAPEDPRVPILAWHSVPEDQLTPERFRELADMGITHSLMHYSPAGNARALDLAVAVGVKLFVSDARLLTPGDGLVDAVKSLRSHAALAGYSLRDEPSAADFATLAAARDAIEAVDPEHWSYVNLFPTYASPAQLGAPTYPVHLRRFLLQFRPRVLSFDHYPVLEGDRLRPDYYQNLEWIRQGALEAGVPFWAFALTCPHRPYPMPTVAHLRLQIWSNIAYGATGVQYFTYWTPEAGTWDFHDAPLRRDGSRSPTYALLQSMNREVQACAARILEDRVVAVFHTEPRPDGTQALDDSCPLARVTGGDALISVRQSHHGQRHLLVLNRSLTRAATLELTPQSWVRRLDRDRIPDGARWVGGSERTVSVHLEPGAAVWLRWE